MAVLNVEIVVMPKDVGGHDRSELGAVLRIVCPVDHVDHALSVRVALVGMVRRPL